MHPQHIRNASLVNKKNIPQLFRLNECKLLTKVVHISSQWQFVIYHLNHMFLQAKKYAAHLCQSVLMASTSNDVVSENHYKIHKPWHN